MTDPRPRPQPAVAMPAFLAHPATWTLGMLALLTPFFVKIPLGLRRSPYVAPFGDQFHVVLLGCVALLLYWRGPLRGRLWPAAGAAAAIGGAIEFLQKLVGREALFHDFLLDLVGIGMVVGWVLWRGHGRRAGGWLFVALLITVPAQLYYVPGLIAATLRARELFPVIADFEAGRDRWLWSSLNDGELTFPVIDDSPTGPGRILRLAGGPPDDWPGCRARRFPHDWSGRTRLVFTARCVGGDSLPIGIRLEDFPGAREDRFARANVTIDGRWRDYAVELVGLRLEDGGRDLMREDVDLVAFYLPRPEARGVLEIDDIRLE